MKDKKEKNILPKKRINYKEKDPKLKTSYKFGEDNTNIDVLETEISNGLKILNELDTDYQDITKYDNDIIEQTTKIVKDSKAPSKSIARDISSTNLVIDLSLAVLARRTALKLNKLEDFLAIIEDDLLKKETLESLSKSDKLSLLTNLRLLRSDSLKNLETIKQTVNFTETEANILAMSSQEEMNELKNNNMTMDNMLTEFFKSEEFLSVAKKTQTEELSNKNRKK